MVPDLKHNKALPHPTLMRELNLDQASFRRISDRVANNILNRPSQQLRIPQHITRPRAGVHKANVAVAPLRLILNVGKELLDNILH